MQHPIAVSKGDSGAVSLSSLRSGKTKRSQERFFTCYVGIRSAASTTLVCGLAGPDDRVDLSPRPIRKPDCENTGH